MYVFLFDILYLYNLELSIYNVLGLIIECQRTFSKAKVQSLLFPSLLFCSIGEVDEYDILEEEELEVYCKFALLGQLCLTKYVKLVVS